LRLGADSPTTVDGRIHRGSLQLSACDSADGEAAVAVDARARVTLPVGLRRAALVAGGVLVGTRRSSAVVVVTTISGLDWLGDALVAAR
jgi:hypothetical protein